MALTAKLNNNLLSFDRLIMDLTDLKDISILLGIWVAIYGIDSWRRQHIGTRSIELAEETLALFYEARDAIKHIRHPGGYTSEMDTLEKNPGESESEYQARKDASVVFFRYDKKQELFNKIYSLRYRFMAQIGKDKSVPFDEMHKIVNEIFSSARRLARHWPKEKFRTEEEITKHQKKIEELENIFWDTFEENDPINGRLDDVINQMEKICQDVIMGKGTLFSFLNIQIGKR